MAQEAPFFAKVVVHTKDNGEFEFTNAQSVIAAPGVLIVADAHSELGMFPLGAVVAVTYPEGRMKVVSV
jgi:hypothetical protein